MKDYKPMRGLTDKNLAEILDNHAMLITKLIRYVQVKEKGGIIRRAWAATVTLAVLYLLFRPLADAVLVQVGTLLHHIL